MIRDSINVSLEEGINDIINTFLLLRLINTVESNSDNIMIFLISYAKETQNKMITVEGTIYLIVDTDR